MGFIWQTVQGEFASISQHYPLAWLRLAQSLSILQVDDIDQSGARVGLLPIFIDFIEE